MYRREVFKAGIGVLGFNGLSGCAGSQLPGLNGGTEFKSTPTETAAGSPVSSATETPVPFPETCKPLPDINGLPTPPSELTADTVKRFVSDFERVYAVATNDHYGDVKSLYISSIEKVGERYVVSLSFDAVPVTPTPNTGGTTPTPLPTDAYIHRVVYRLTEERMLRELRSHIDNSLLSKTCWLLESG